MKKESKKYSAEIKEGQFIYRTFPSGHVVLGIGCFDNKPGANNSIDGRASWKKVNEFCNGFYSLEDHSEILPRLLGVNARGLYNMNLSYWKDVPVPRGSVQEIIYLTAYEEQYKFGL